MFDHNSYYQVRRIKA